MAKLNTHVYVMHEGNTVGFGPEDDVPESVARQLGAHVFENGEHPFPDGGRSAGSPPPKAGPGSGADSWSQYAAELGVQVPEGAKRDEIVQAISDAGKPVE